MIYQFFNLLSTLTVRENVMLPALLGGRPELEAAPRANMLIEEVGMKQRQDARPHTLSGGEMQRTAIARALMQSPPLDPGRRTHRQSGLPNSRSGPRITAKYGRKPWQYGHSGDAQPGGRRHRRPSYRIVGWTSCE